MLSLSGSIAFTLEEYGVIHVRRRDALLPFFRDDQGRTLLGSAHDVSGQREQAKPFGPAPFRFVPVN
jgi:hypothetical protein